MERYKVGDSMVMLDGLGIAGYRSFGDEMQTLSDFGKVNIFIGKNNSGKSNILKLIEIMPHLIQQTANINELIELNKEDGSKKIDISFQIRNQPPNKKLFDEIIDVISLTTPSGKSIEEIWLPYSFFDFQNKKYTFNLSDYFKVISDKQIKQMISRQHATPNNDKTQNIENLKNIVHSIMTQKYFSSFESIYIPDERWITKEKFNNDMNRYSGNGLYYLLKEYDSPGFSNLLKTNSQYKNFLKLLKQLLGCDDLQIIISDNKEDFIVIIDEKPLPLSNWGTGVHQLILLAFADALNENKLICLEEPELFLHQELQKKYLNYIVHNSKNQYFISSHSNAFFDCKDVRIYRCFLDKRKTKCEKANNLSIQCNILDDLGYKASDILQSNCIIWVEGPSDRIYLNHWIKNKNPELEEGLHYTIMFYGGKLLYHLKVEDEESSDVTEDIDEFIKLNKINRNYAILIDSDLDNKDGKLNKTKKRIEEEFEKNSAFYWITNCREIENYFEKDIILGAINKIHKTNLTQYDQYEKITEYTNTKGNVISINKLKVAYEVIKSPPTYNKWGLQEKVDKLIDFIKKSNLK